MSEVKKWVLSVAIVIAIVDSIFLWLLLGAMFYTQMLIISIVIILSLGVFTLVAVTKFNLVDGVFL